MLGAKYKYRYWLNGGVVGDVIYYKSKLMPSVTVLSQLQPTSAFGLMVSYTVQNYSLNNLGLGLFLGKNPLQFYIVSDNALAVLKPLDTRMTNVRFGLNINFGCKERKEKSSTKGYSSGNCYGMNNNQKAYMKKLKPWSKRNKNK